MQQPSEEFGPFVVVSAVAGKALVPLGNPHLRVIGGRTFVCGTVAFEGEYWLNGTGALLPFEEVKAIFSFSSGQEYVLAVAKHRAREKAKKADKVESESVGTNPVD